jgi:protein-S-isoprenylcysteine O-methyltransferase Ste14
VHWPTLFSVGLFPVIVLAYGLLSRNEEKQVLKQFGEEYRSYQQRVPMFFPRMDQWQQLVDMSNTKNENKPPHQ